MKEELARLEGDERTLARGVLEELVTSQGTKAVKAASELALALEVDGSDLEPVLEKLVRARLLRVLEREDGGTAYELSHEYLIREIDLGTEAKTRKQAEELIKQEMENWRHFGTLLAADKLALVSEVREVLRLDVEAQEFLLRSALHAGRVMDYWLSQVEDETQRAKIAYDCLHDDQVEVRDRTAQVLRTWAVPEVSRMLMDVVLEDETALVRRQAAESLQAMEGQGEAGLVSLLDAAQSSDRRQRRRALDGLAWYLHVAGQRLSLPRRLQWPVQTRLARIRLREARPQIDRQTRAGGLAALLGALPFLMYLALDTADDVLTAVMILVVLASLSGVGGILLGGGLAVVRAITRGWNAAVRVGSMGLAGALLGLAALLPISLRLGGWAAGLALGLLLAVVDVADLRPGRRAMATLGAVVGAITGLIGLLLAQKSTQGGTLLDEVLPTIAIAVLAAGILGTSAVQSEPSEPGKDI